MLESLPEFVLLREKLVSPEAQAMLRRAAGLDLPVVEAADGTLYRRRVDRERADAYAVAALDQLTAQLERSRAEARWRSHLALVAVLVHATLAGVTAIAGALLAAADGTGGWLVAAGGGSLFGAAAGALLTIYNRENTRLDRIDGELQNTALIRFQLAGAEGLPKGKRDATKEKLFLRRVDLEAAE